MYENQFLKFTSTIDPQECGVPLPVVFGGDGIAFFVDVDENANTVFTIVDASGVPFKDKNGDILSGSFRNMVGNYVRNMFGVLPTYHYQQGLALFHASQSRDFVAPNECFRIRVETPKTVQASSWLDSNYPFKGYEDASQAFAALGLKTDVHGIGEVVITTHEVQSESVLSGMAGSSSIPKYENDLYYVTGNGKYFVWNGSAFVNITDMAQMCKLFGESAKANVYFMSDGHTPLLTADIPSPAHILFRTSREKRYNLHITGFILAGHTWGSTAGQIIAKYRGVQYNSFEYQTYMTSVRSTGGFDINGVTESEYNMLVACGIDLSVNSTYYQHTFEHEAFAINSIGDRFIYNEQFVYYTPETEYEYRYSNLLRRYENPEGLLALVEYSCGTETFGLPFTTDRPIRQWLPIIVKDPKPEQKDEIYTKLSGERVVMYATIDEKYSCETDYIPYEWHKRIVMALSCDIVKINGVRLTKSESYEINWEDKIKLECGEKLTKAEWKMVANITSRNSNN